MVDRYELVGEYDWTRMGTLEDGDYVLASDYDALEAKLDRLVECAKDVLLTRNDSWSGNHRWDSKVILNLKAAVNAAKRRE